MPVLFTNDVLFATGADGVGAGGGPVVLNEVTMGGGWCGGGGLVGPSAARLLESTGRKAGSVSTGFVAPKRDFLRGAMIELIDMDSAGEGGGVEEMSGCEAGSNLSASSCRG